ncbi:MAG: PAAR domain-containing protein [Enhygromyxa sp.]
MSHAARVNDPHSCPLSTPFAHGGGLISGPGVETVKIGHLAAATAGTTCTCAGGVPNVITGGSGTVKIGYQPAARVGDSTAHGGVISKGCSTVVIGG